MDGVESVRVIDQPVVAGGDVHRLVEHRREDAVRRPDAHEGHDDDGDQKAVFGPSGHADTLSRLVSRILHSGRRGRVTLRTLFLQPFRSARRSMMVRMWTALLFAVALAAPALLAQQPPPPPPPPLPPEVGDAVLLATHSIQVDRDTVVTRGDLVVNDAGPAPWLGERGLPL